MAVSRNSATLPRILLPIKRLTILLLAAVASIPAAGQKTVLDGNILQTKCASYENYVPGTHCQTTKPLLELFVLATYVVWCSRHDDYMEGI